MLVFFELLFRVPHAEKEGFEPPEVLPSTVFKTAAFDRSAISPNALINSLMRLQMYDFF
ncbi:conserved hypothetical protein [Capnocytophaga canimorsus]|uniref:Uncharacterized protein n=1 Tax=Capnocytophaga canimorsus TaxID=28188 RepID=A0A0B7H2J1_9FLAO|nr:conserved hypothetical protein [Capnocytophaga canimorsus]